MLSAGNKESHSLITRREGTGVRGIIFISSHISVLRLVGLRNLHFSVSFAQLHGHSLRDFRDLSTTGYPIMRGTACLYAAAITVRLTSQHEVQLGKRG